MHLEPGQREAIRRLDAPLFKFRYGWSSLWVTDESHLAFYPRVRRTFVFSVRGYPVITVSGRVHSTERQRRTRKLPYPLKADGKLKW